PQGGALPPLARIPTPRGRGGKAQRKPRRHARGGRMSAPVDAPVVESAPRKAAPAKGGRRTDEVLRAFHEESDIVKAYDARLLGRLWPFIRPHAAQLYLSLFLLLITAAASLVRPLIMRSIIDAGSIARDRSVMMRGAWLSLGVVG